VSGIAGEIVAIDAESMTIQETLMPGGEISIFNFRQNPAGVYFECRTLLRHDDSFLQ
jgi:hypothetical protein